MDEFQNVINSFFFGQKDDDYLLYNTNLPEKWNIYFSLKHLSVIGNGTSFVSIHFNYLLLIVYDVINVLFLAIND